MNVPLYGDRLEINNDFYSDTEETEIVDRKTPFSDGNAAVNAVVRIMEGYETNIPEHLISELKYVIKILSIFLKVCSEIIWNIFRLKRKWTVEEV